jgi:hypothetical protein
MKVFGGQLVVTLQSAEKAGVIRLQVSGKGLQAGNVQIMAKE